MPNCPSVRLPVHPHILALSVQQVYLVQKKDRTRQYERFTQRGFLMRVYRNMLSRVVGVQKREAQYYQGLPLLPKNLFYMWAVGDPTFQHLWIIWQSSDLERKLTPSIDRINALRGYTLDNMQWLTQAKNSGKVLRRPISYPSKAGVNSYNAKLTAEQVKAIRRDYRPRKKGAEGNTKALAQQHNVRPDLIYMVAKGRTYKESV